MNAAEPGPVVVDLRAVQSPDHRGRGVARYAYELALGLERVRPELVGRYLLAPDWPPPGDIEPLLATGKVAYLGEGGDLPPGTRLYHSMSPFELSVGTGSIWPALVEERGLRFSATVYDLIPLRLRETYLVDARQRRRYSARLEVLRHADALLAISHASERDVIDLVGVPADRVTTIGTAVGSRLRPPPSRYEAFEAARRALPQITDPFVLYPGGSDGRKNVEALIRAFGQLPAPLRQSHQLVIPCDLAPLAANHFHHVAAGCGIADRLVLPGFVTDGVLELLYQSTSLVCYPSLAEGFGLPVAEAMACGAVVVASDVPPIGELVADEARFDPRDVRSIAAAIERGLSDPGLRTASARAATLLDTWDDVAERAAKVLESLAVAPPRRWKRPNRVAFVSPFPPVASGVAAYSAKLVGALAEALPDVVVDCFADGRNRNPAEPELPGDRHWWDARVFAGVEGAVGGYDDVVYVIGNSEYHAGALAALRARAGLVMAHEVRLGNLLRFSTEMPGAVPGGLQGAIRRSYGDLLPERLGRWDELSAEDEEQYGLLMLRDVLACTDRLVVSSESARRLAEVDAGPELAGRIGVVPFALAMASEELEAIRLARNSVSESAAREPAGRLVASFGIVHETKQPLALVDAVAELSRQRDEPVTLAFVGPVSAELDRAITEHAVQSGLPVTVTGSVSRPEYLAWLARTEIAVQLRTTFNGEASAAVGDCLAAGLPTVVSNVGWLGDLPSDVVERIDRDACSAELAEVLGSLLGDPSRRAQVAAAAALYAAEHTFAVVADALVEHIRVGLSPEHGPVEGGVEVVGDDAAAGAVSA